MQKPHLYTLSFIIFLFLGLTSHSIYATDRFLGSGDSYSQISHEQQGNTHHYRATYQGADNDWRGSKIVKNIHMILEARDFNTLNFRVIDDDNKRWEIPNEYPWAHFDPKGQVMRLEDSNFDVNVQENPFAIVIKRKDTSETLFDSTSRTFIYSDFYIELSTSLPTNNVYGFGERNYKFKMTPGTYSIWPRDDAKIFETGMPGGNTYGHHPVGLVKGTSGNFFLTFMRNSNAMDIIIEGNPSLTYKMTGGVIDLVIFAGDQYPDTVLKAYHQFLGNYTMMPFWSMGFHQSKWGYSTADIMTDIVTNYINHEIPMDVIWSDIDYMIDKEIFTIDSWRYPSDKMKAFKTQYKKHWVPIIDPGVKNHNTRGPGLSEGLKRDIFIKTANGGNLVGYVWPGDTHFPDFLNPECEPYWGEMLDVLYNTVPFDGIWLDMNEIANFVDGDTSRHNAGKYQNLPYNVGEFNVQRKTISLDAKHHNDIVEFNVHSHYNLFEIKATHTYLQTKSKLPFILTRANSPGVGRFSAHWTGDNGASWDFLKYSISGNFAFQIFGIPFVGADICGFMDGTTEELCARWTQLGALYPFARNHHEDRTRNQEPWTFTGNNRGVTVLETARVALKTRYALLKWYYSLFIETRGSGSVFRPLFFEFPEEQILYDQESIVDSQFMLADSVLCTPKVEGGEPFVTAYFPKTTWFDLFTGEEVIDGAKESRTLRVETPFDAPVPHFIRAGHIVHQQNVDAVLSTYDLNDEFELIIAFNKEEQNSNPEAKGYIMGIQNFDDDSVYNRCIIDNCLYGLTATVTSQDSSSASIEIAVSKQDENSFDSLDDLGLYSLKLYGLDLRFMDEDERKIGYALVQVKNNDEVTTNPNVKRLTPMANGAFKLELEEKLRIQDGDNILIELII